MPYKSIHYSVILCHIFLLFLFIFQPGRAQAQANIVNPKQVYSYSIMQRDIERLAAAYPDLVSVQTLGKTAYGRELWAVKLGRGESVLFLNGSHHAREWMTTTLLMKIFDTYAQSYYLDKPIGPYDVREILNHVSIWIVPMVNPDGVTLSQQGTAGLPKEATALLNRYNRGSANFTRWKANMQGLDLNRQYPANWSMMKNAVHYPNYQNYSGIKPVQAPEVKMMMDFTYKMDPDITVSYHSSGGIIFWHYHTLAANLVRDREIASSLARLTGYSLVRPEKNPSGGGYKDWFIQEFERPGFTIEIGNYAGEGSLPLSAFGNIWAENRQVPLYTASQAYKLWLKRQSVQILNQKMSLLTETPVYPGAGAATSSSVIASQEVLTLARKGDWYRIKTGSGAGWIHPAPGHLGIVEEIDADADIKQATALRKYPDAFAPKVAFLSQQSVKVTGRLGTWLRVASGEGKWWIDGREAVLRWPVKSTGTDNAKEGPSAAPENAEPDSPAPEMTPAASPVPVQPLGASAEGISVR
ncbi:g-D-glutamyl-meso-diaminopimelate peptidase [Paenibacillus sophorae]|uniref:G-D-glutamyl-meso-diaminopimelate peptidase n=1 Tax=Paenibacillus sophorae TaxID=1333845 RepID=A0A1H8L4C1_9BACL|nr:M14 family metallocarboxypeptidase [Paenibacillus sophorae]QWU17439.1 M14 family metallocarboxypeptidase [Paenibacillus sophorae]SEN99959.1 g-D-glutamyl-meso-diaminopimelate peptidase [Paenibacillus sophorae]